LTKRSVYEEIRVVGEKAARQQSRLFENPPLKRRSDLSLVG